MNIRQAETKDLKTVAALASRLWPHHSPEELEEEFREIFTGAAFFLAEDGCEAVGFAQCQLRHDYVEGTESSPVGYLEGIFVSEACRGRGVAKMLLGACENWARGQGCREFASDCELDNRESLAFHLGVGFQEANRIICFAKRI